MELREAQTLVALNPERYRVYEDELIKLVEATAKGESCLHCAVSPPGLKCPRTKNDTLLCVDESARELMWLKVE